MPHAPFQYVLNTLLYVLITGCRWCDVPIRLCLPSVALGQVSTDNLSNNTNIALTSGFDADTYAKEAAETLINNGDPADLSIRLEKNKFEKPFRRSLLSWKRVTDRIGGIYLDLKGSLEFPKNFSLGNNEVIAQATLSVRHEGFNDAEKLPPHFQAEFVGQASDRELLSELLSRKIASADLTFEGLMLKGVPEYLEQTTAIKKLKENRLNFEKAPGRDDKARLSKTIEVKLDQLNFYLNSLALKRLNARLDANKQDALKYRKEISVREPALRQLRQLRQVLLRIADRNEQKELIKQRIEKIEKEIEESRTKLQGVKNDIKVNLADKQKVIANLPLSASFTCAPEFMREFKFPIVERRVSTSTQGASGSAGAGVSGDVVIDISAPTCSIEFSPPFPFKVKSSVYSDVTVSSNGYFGVRAEGSAQQEFGIKFSGKYGNYTVPTFTLSEEEKQAIADVVLKIENDVNNDEQVLKELASEIKNKMIDSTVSAIETALIGSDGSPFAASEVCSLFNKIGNLTYNEESLCWASKITTFREPVKEVLDPKARKEIEQEALKKLRLTSVPKPPGPKPSVVCNRIVAAESCTIPRQTIIGPPRSCATRKEPFKVCRDRIEVAGGQKPGCEEAKKPVQKACSWMDADKVYNDFTRIVQEITATRQGLIDKSYEAARANFNRWKAYSDRKVVGQIAKAFVRNRILVSSDVIDTKAIAKEMLKLAFNAADAGSKVNRWIDLTNQYLKTLAPGINVSASGRIAFNAKAHLLETRPQVTAESVFRLNNGKPSFDENGTKITGYVNGPNAQEGRIGGLDQIGIRFFSKQIACLGGKVDESSEGLSCSSGRAIAKYDTGDKPWFPTKEPQGGEKIPANQELKVDPRLEFD